MRKLTLLIICLVLLFGANLFAEGITLELNFPQKSTAKITAPKPLLKPQEVSGSLILDIVPYPAAIEKERYLVEYFLDGQLIYQTTGFNESSPDKLSFTYLLDSAKFENGKHKIIINFWDKKGPSAIGIREVVIKNE